MKKKIFDPIFWSVVLVTPKESRSSTSFVKMTSWNEIVRRGDPKKWFYCVRGSVAIPYRWAWGYEVQEKGPILLTMNIMRFITMTYF